jgi:hypothetical protein
VSKHQAHPFADDFPMMTDLEIEALADDIRENGQRHPIVRALPRIDPRWPQPAAGL